MSARPSLVIRLSEARAAGIDVGRTAYGALTLRAPREAVPLATALRLREADVLALYDWTRAVVADAQPCLLCSRPALLRDPVDHQPCHKICVDVLIRCDAPPSVPMPVAA